MLIILPILIQLHINNNLLLSRCNSCFFSFFQFKTLFLKENYTKFKMWYYRRKKEAAEINNIKKGQVRWKITANKRLFFPTGKDSTIQFVKLFYLSLSGSVNDLSVLINTQTLLNRKLHTSNMSNLDTVKENVN